MPDWRNGRASARLAYSGGRWRLLRSKPSSTRTGTQRAVLGPWLRDGGVSWSDAVLFVDSVIATGAVRAGGRDISGNKIDAMKFPTGTFRIAHMGHPEGQPHPERPAWSALRAGGTYTLSQGTGAHKGISGSGRYKLSIELVARRASNGKCSMNVKPTSFQFMVDAMGPVSLP